MIPLTADRAALIKAIKALEASGGTAGQTGVVWGWNSLSPNYANLWPAESEPVSYDDDQVLKFAVIMTDGDNNRHYRFTETRSEYVCTGKGKSKTCTWEEIAVNAWEEVSEGRKLYQHVLHDPAGSVRGNEGRENRDLRRLFPVRTTVRPVRRT